MASDLLAFGRDTKDPLVLIVAARIMKALGGTEVDLRPEGKAAAGNTQKSGQPVSANSILAEARDLAKGEKIINLLIDETAAMGVAGGAGPAQNPSRHRPTRRHRRLQRRIRRRAVGRSWASPVMAAATSISSSTTRTTISSAAAPASTDREYCRWWPRWTGPFRIEVQNLGAIADFYRLAMN